MHQVTLIEGDGIGPEVIQATQRLIAATGIPLTWEKCEAGKRVFEKGLSSGVPPETIASLKKTKVALKGPLETPIGYGEKSANVTLRTLFDTYANIRPVRTLPGIPTPFQDRAIDFVIIRENVEDVYAGIEYMQTPTTAEALKLITRKGSEDIIRLAFEFARAESRRKIHCATKANILKLTEGLFKSVFEEVAKDYPDIEAHHILIDNCAHQMVVNPEQFDVIVTTNLHGDIISDLGSGLVGGLGVAASANIGNEVAIFEAVHGSAPDIAGKNWVNPTATFFSSIAMLRHLGEFEGAHRIEQALLYTLERSPEKTRDLDKTSSLTTTAFTDRVIENLGRTTSFWPSRPYSPLHIPSKASPPPPVVEKTIGVDIFLESTLSPTALGESLEALCHTSPFQLKMISNRGVQVYPTIEDLHPTTVTHWRARFFFKEGERDDDLLLDFIKHIAHHHPWMHIEKLKEFNQKPGFTKTQGEA